MSTKKIANLNDRLRQTGQGGRVLMTKGVSDKGLAFSTQAQAKVRTFEDFIADNDPHGERDFGSFELLGEQVMWKMDYYNVGLSGGSEDASDEAVTCRVLTIMLASEY